MTKNKQAYETSTPPNVLADLAKDEDIGVRRGVAGNPSAPAEVLVKLLSGDIETRVRRDVAENPNTPC